MKIEDLKRALNIAIQSDIGFEGNAKDAAGLLSLITGLESRIAELERDKKALKGIKENLREHIDIGTLQLSAANARIAELEAAQRWIPVSERLPDNWEFVLTFDMSQSTRVPVTAFYNPETSLWATHFSCGLWVTHWMPLPESPIVYGKVCEE